jgi:hypothetical protein
VPITLDTPCTNRNRGIWDWDLGLGFGIWDGMGLGFGIGMGKGFGIWDGMGGDGRGWEGIFKGRQVYIAILIGGSCTRVAVHLIQ